MALDPQSSERTQPSRPGSEIGIVVSRFHEELTGAMKDSAVRELVACGVEEEDILVVWVPGAFELPVVAARLAEETEVEAVLCFGLVLKGETELWALPWILSRKLTRKSCSQTPRATPPIDSRSIT